MSETRHSIQDLQQLYNEGESADREIFAEMRSNIQLIAGEHYTKRGNKFWNRLRDSKEITHDQKIRLTKNHIRKIHQTYVNSITGYAPGVYASPKDKASMQHQKTAELVNSVWEDGKSRHDFPQKINQLANDFCGIGEVFTKTFFDPSAGRFLGEEAAVDEFGQVILGEDGQPVSSGMPKFAGDVVVERIFGFNIIRPNGCKDLRTAPWLCHRKMVDTKDIKNLVKASSLSDEEKEELISKVVDSPDQTYTILDGSSSSYKTVKGQTMLKEWFFRSCLQYPRGYFYITLENAILFEGELPFGIFPIDHEGFDEIQTTPRARSIVKQLRPYQIEVNRCASKISEHQISLGSDKVLVQNGTKLVPGIALPGVRTFQYSGAPPIIMEGRTGDQYLGYMNSQISEMYQVAAVEEIKEEKGGQFDVYSMLFKSIKDKKKFSVYTDKFEGFLKRVFKTYISLCQNYYTEQHLVPAIGKSEYINIAEFKDVGDLDYVIKLEAQSDDSESKLGKQLSLQHIIQYVGPQLAQKDLGKVIRMLPYANEEQILEDLTMDYDFATNLMLSLDRGKPAVVNPYVQDPAYVINKLVNRATKPDFEFLSEEVKQLYAQAINDYQTVKVDQEIKLKQAQSEFIPTGGFLVACDFYVPDPNNPEKLPKRVRIPSEAVDWLLKQLQAQGSDQKTLNTIESKGALADMSQMLLNKLGRQGGGAAEAPQATSPMSEQQFGQTNPGGQYGY